MNRLTRTAYELLKVYKHAYLTPDNTTIDKRRKRDDELLINHGTARALERRGLAKRVTVGEHPMLQLVEGVEL